MASGSPVDLYINIVDILVTITSSGGINNTVLVGDGYSLVCSVTVSGSADRPIITWLRPINSLGVVNVTGNVNTLTFSSLVSSDAGTYTCRAALGNALQTADINVMIIPLPPPTNLRAVATTPTSITLTWEQPEGADAVDRYEINYHYFIEECEFEGSRPFPPVTISVNDGTLRRYTLNNSASTPVEEDCLFRITLTAINNAARSITSQPTMTTTAEAAPGLVQSLTASSVNMTSITIRWDRVDCQERNGHTDGYRIIYYPTLNSNDRGAWTSVGTGDNDRMFSITGLSPRTSYTFEVQASNFNIDMHGPPAVYTASTTAHQEMTTVNATVPATTVLSTTVTLPPTTIPATTVPLPQPLPPLGVQGLCSFVVWYSPAVQSCEDIHGYEVRLYSTSPQSSHPNMTNRVGANATFYMVEEEKLPNSHETYVQVRVIHQTGQVGEWSEGISLGCEKPTAPEKPPRVYFELNREVYLNNSALPLTDVGEGTSALYCRTDKEECCGTLPNRFGRFYYPSGVQVPIKGRQQGFYRNRGSQLIRLNRREGITSPTGTYRCEIPNADDETVKIYITLTG